jgi:hypothetical protein
VKVDQAIGSFTLHTNPAKPGVLLAGEAGSRLHQHRCSTATQIDFRRCECLDRLSSRFTKIVGEALKPSGTESWRDWPVSPSSGVTAIVQGSLLPPTHPAHNWHEKLLEAGSSIRRQYRFGSCRRKQQSTRDECGEALLDIERGEMVRSQRGTVA